MITSMITSKMHVVGRIALAATVAACLEFIIMQFVNISAAQDAFMVFIIFIVASGLVMIPELIRARRFHNSNVSLKKDYSDLVRVMDLQSSLNINSIMFTNMDDAVVITDSSNLIVMINPAFTDLTGYSLADVVGKNPRILSSGKTTGETYKTMWNALLSTGKWSGVLSDKSKSGSIYNKHIKIYAVRNESHKIENFIGIFFNADSQHIEGQRYKTLAMYDALTGIPNRNLFFDRVNGIFNESGRTKEVYAIFFIDLDDFKNINDVHGHQYGDLVLKVCAERIQKSLRDTDTVARLGGDEFAVIVRNIKEDVDMGDVAKNIINELEKPIFHESLCFNVSGSIGIALSDGDVKSSHTLIQSADIAMYDAKHAGKGQFKFFDDKLRQNFEARASIESNLSSAIKNNELIVLLQPQINMDTGKIKCAEALVRWIKDGKIIPPSEFLKTAEKTNLIADIDQYVFNKVMDIIGYQLQGLYADIGYKFPISVNLSTVTIQKMDYGESNFIFKAISEHPICQFDDIELEITETAIMKSQDKAIPMFRQLCCSGITIAIDDFGTGHSSLAYIQEFPISTIKIDKMFIDKIQFHGSKNVGIIKFIQTLAGALDIQTVAEGVETKDQLVFLRGIGVDAVQGYYYSRPLDVERFTQYCMAYNHFSKVPLNNSKG